MRSSTRSTPVTTFVDKNAGFEFALPGGTSDGKLKAKKPGEYAYVCFVENENGPHYRQGMFNASPPNSRPASSASRSSAAR